MQHRVTHYNMQQRTSTMFFMQHPVKKFGFNKTSELLYSRQVYCYYFLYLYLVSKSICPTDSLIIIVTLLSTNTHIFFAGCIRKLSSLLLRKTTLLKKNIFTN